MMKWNVVLFVAVVLIVAVRSTSPPRLCVRRGCPRPQPLPGCKHVMTYHPNGTHCPPCRICRDADLKKLSCPNGLLKFQPERQCNSVTDCPLGKLCCGLGRRRKCKPGIVMAPKPGICPKIIARGCMRNYKGCRYDSSCPGAQKCCSNSSCKYRQMKCSAVVVKPPPKRCVRRGCPRPQPLPGCKHVMTYHPNGKHCPPCRICRDADLKKLGCPNGSFMFEPERGLQCNSVTDCSLGKLCCKWGRGQECKPGIVVAPKPGICPKITVRGCMMDFNGCQYDRSCPGAQKCCYNSTCKYRQCSAVAVKPKYSCRRVLLLCKSKWCKAKCRRMKRRYCRR